MPIDFSPYRSNLNIILSGPSAVGKSYILKSLLDEPLLQTAKVIRDTTRERRKEERNGVDYNFRSETDFKELIELDKRQGDIFLQWKIHDIYYYGTTYEEYLKALKTRQNVVFDVDVFTALDIEVKILKKDLHVLNILIIPIPLDELHREGGVDKAIAVLRERRTGRGSGESGLRLADREQVARNSLAQFAQFSYIVPSLNQKIDESIKEVKTLIKESQI